MQIIKESTTYYAYAFDYPFNYPVLNFCRSLKEKYGYKEFGFYEKKWRFNNPLFFNLIKQAYPEIIINEALEFEYKQYKLQKLLKQEQIKNAQRIKQAKSSALEIKNIKGNLYEFQKLGVEFLINSNGKAILADEMGCGKTVQAITYIVHQKISKTLVICPASVKWSWHDEIKIWSNLKPFVIGSKIQDIPLVDYDIFIINFDILHKFFPILITARWDCTIVDEFTYAKNLKTRRTKNTMQIVKRSSSVLLLSGTPILNRPVELFTALHMIDPLAWNNWFLFTQRYCQGHYGRWGYYDYSGASNISELRNKIEHYFLRRTKEEVLTELPPKRFVDIPMELENGYRSQYDFAVESFKEYLKSVKNKTDVEIRKSLQAEKLVRLGELRRIASLGKIAIAKEIIENVINEGNKVVVFSSYNAPLEQFYQKFQNKAVMLTGKTSINDRRNIIDSFQNNNAVKVFLGGIRSAGIGITLTASSTVLFIDFPWTPAEYNQSQDRCHRVGQKNSVLIYQIIAKDTIDSKMQELLLEKQAIFDQLFDAKRKQKGKSVSIIDDLINSLT